MTPSHKHDQHDHHDHDHTPGDKDNDSSFTEKNRQYFNDLASRYTEHQWQRDFINNMTNFILANINWIGVNFNDPSSTFETSPSQTPVRVFDYACGPGTITNVLDNRATEYVGVDLSDKMVDWYNNRFQNDAPSSQKFTAHAIVGNLLDQGESSWHLQAPEFFNFDLAVVGAGFHHFTDVQLAANLLTERLKPGGVLMIVDFLSYESKEKVEYISHHGFSEERVRELFGKAGLVDVDVVVDEKEWMLRESSKRGFMARGRKPGSSNL